MFPALSNHSSPAVAITPFLVVTTFCIDFTSKHVQAITYMKHGVGVDAVVAGVAAPVGIDPTFIVALLSEKVVEVERHNQRLALEERLGELSIPDELVGVARWVIVATAAVFMQIG